MQQFDFATDILFCMELYDKGDEVDEATWKAEQKAASSTF